MSGDKRDKGIWSGIMGGLVVNFFNQINSPRTNRIEDLSETLDNGFDFRIFRSFSGEERKKREGYKLEHDINESKVKAKLINLVQINKYLYTVTVDNERIKNNLKYSGPHMEWEIVKLATNYMLEEALYEKVIIFTHMEPSYWVYSIEQSDKYIKIIITDQEINNHSKIHENYMCLNINEAQDLAKEMKRFYHNYFERVAILEEIDKPWVMDTNEHKAMIIKTVPNYYNLLEMIGEIGILKYDEIGEHLENSRFDKPLNILYTLLSLSIQLYNDGYSKIAIVILESLIKIDRDLLDESGLENKIYEYLLQLYIGLEKENKITDLIENSHQYDYYFMTNIAEKLYALGFYKAANAADRILIEDSHRQFNNKYSTIYFGNLFKSYVRAGDDEGLKIYREKLIDTGWCTWEIDRYLANKDIDGLGIKIGHLVKDEKWAEVISHCNQYNKLIVDHPWKAMGERVDYEFQKINAYIKTENYAGAWNSSCKSRITLIANFNNVDHLNDLSRLETYMMHICLKQDYLIDAMYHHVLSLLYKNIFDHYTASNTKTPIWSRDLFSEDLIQKTNIEELWFEIESMIKTEYKNISGKTIRNINTKMISILEREDFNLVLNGPKKYFPTIIDRNFDVKQN